MSNLIPQENWLQGKFYTEAELKTIIGPSDSRWSLQKRFYCGQEMFVYVYDYTKHEYPLCECESEDSDDDDDEFYTSNYCLDFKEDIDESSSFQEADVIVKPPTEIHSMSTEVGLIGGQRNIKFARGYLIDGSMSDKLVYRIGNKPQSAGDWRVFVHYRTNYSGVSGKIVFPGGRETYFLNHKAEGTRLDSDVYVDLKMSTLDGGTAEIDVFVEFVVYTPTVDSCALYPLVEGDGVFTYCTGGIYNSSRNVSISPKLGVGRVFMPTTMKDVVWSYIRRRWFGFISGWIDYDIDKDKDQGIVQVWLESNYCIVKHVIMEIKKYCVYQSRLSGIDVVCLQDFSDIMMKHFVFSGWTKDTIVMDIVRDCEVQSIVSTSCDGMVDRTATPPLIMTSDGDLPLVCDVFGDDVIARVKKK